MSAEQIIFIILTVITLGSGISVVTNRNLLHAALALMLSFLGVAGYYVLLGSGFLAAAQLLVYIGAISILILFDISPDPSKGLFSSFNFSGSVRDVSETPDQMNTIQFVRPSKIVLKSRTVWLSPVPNSDDEPKRSCQSVQSLASIFEARSMQRAHNNDDDADDIS